MTVRFFIIDRTFRVLGNSPVFHMFTEQKRVDAYDCLYINYANLYFYV